LLALAAYTAWLTPLAPTQQPVWVITAIFAAALVTSVAGFAFSPLAAAMLFHLLDDPVQVVQIVLVCSVGGQVLMVWALRHDIAWRRLAPFLVGAAAGLPFGIFALLQLRPAAFAQAMGVLLLSSALFRLFRRPLVIRRQPVVLDVAAGFLGGITGGAAAFPSMVVSIWCGFKGWTKEEQRGLCQPFILAVQGAAIVMLMVAKPGSEGAPSFDFAGIAYLPPVLLGSTLGLAFFKRMNDRQFALAINLMLIAAGIGFLV